MKLKPFLVSLFQVALCNEKLKAAYGPSQESWRIILGVIADDVFAVGKQWAPPLQSTHHLHPESFLL